ncbi:MAG: InlB B-repeat-containing protein, partial [Coriobacteriales bacterium]|nr:InlB B-repeat-containing protein [Coriobacteriales bacterium]
MRQSNLSTHASFRGWRKPARLLLVFALLVASIPFSGKVLAQEVCNHVHGDDCSYSEGAACTHLHDESCGEGAVNCTHEHDELCGYAAPVACDHVHDQYCSVVVDGKADESVSGDEIVGSVETDESGALTADDNDHEATIHELLDIDALLLEVDPDGGIASLDEGISPLEADPTVTFMTWETGNIENDPTSYTVIFDTQTPLTGGACVDPGIPSIVPTGTYARVFVGWFALGEESPFVFSTPVFSDLTLYARFAVDWGATVQVATRAELQAAITQAADNTPVTIELTSNIVYANGTEELNIPGSKVIRLKSADLPGSPFAINANSMSRVITLANGGSLTLQDIVITGGRSLSAGGGIWSEGDLMIESGCLITGNSVVGAANGGGVSAGAFYPNTSFVMNGGAVTGNSTAGNGGGVFHFYGDFVMNAGVISDNQANNGGGIYSGWADKFVIINGGQILNNNCPGSGGGIYVFGHASLTDAVISGNTALIGGGVWIREYLTITRGIISDNIATNGGGIYTNYNILMRGGEITRNTAYSSGGGVYLYHYNASFYGYDAIISYNQSFGTAPDDGGGAILAPQYLNVIAENVDFIGNYAVVTYDWLLSGNTEIHHTDLIRNTTYTAPFTNAYNNADINWFFESGVGIFYRQNSGDNQAVYQGPVSAGEIFPDLLTKAQVESMGWCEERDFMYWSESPDGSTGEYIPPANYPSPAVNITLYAIYESDSIDEYSIFYNLAGGENADTNPSSYTIEDLPLSIAAPTKPGYSFTGWTVIYANTDLTNITTPTVSYSAPEGATEAITLMDNWGSATSYSISYNLAGGENSDTNPDTYTIEDLPLSIAAPTKLGYS